MVVNKDNSSLESKVYFELKEAILSRSFQKGEALTELGVSERLGVSRTPVRGALHRLAEEGLIELSPHRGAVVVGVTVEDLIDIYRIRMRLEGLAAALATQHISEKDKKALIESVELSEFYIQKKDPEHLKELDATFHSIIYQASENRMLCKILSDLHRNIKAYRKLSLTISGRPENSVREHREILEAILGGNAEEADRLTSLHVERALSGVLDAINGQDLSAIHS